MSEETRTPTDQEIALAKFSALPEMAPDPDLREWPAPQGVLSTPEGLQATFRAMGFDAVADRRDEEVRFEAWRKPRLAGAILAAVLGVSAYLAISALEFGELAAVASVVAVAYYLPLWILPSYRISGRIRGGRVFVRFEARGLLGSREALERRLRFYLVR